MTEYPRPSYLDDPILHAPDVVPARFARFLLVMVAILAIALCLALALLPADGPASVPRCEEDEVLIAKDFPYTNTDNLRCIHIEEVR